MSKSDPDEWHNVSDSDWESKWQCGVESDSTTDEEDGRKTPEREREGTIQMRAM